MVSPLLLLTVACTVPPHDFSTEVRLAAAEIEAPDPTVFDFGRAAAAAGDLDGDGYADLVVGAPMPYTTGAAFVFHGGPDLIDLGRTVSFYDDAGADDIYGLRVDGGADVDGDGFDDVIVGWRQETADVYFGSPTGVTPGTSAPLMRRFDDQGYDAHARMLGDLDGDGRAEFGIGELSIAVDLYGFDPQRTATLWQSLSQPGSDVGGYGVPTPTGDIDADGYDDLIVRASDLGRAFQPPSVAFLYLGHPEGMVSAGVVEGDWEGIWGVGDVDGDGHRDVLAGDTWLYTVEDHYGAGAVYLYPGGTDGLPDRAALAFMTLDPVDGPDFGRTAAPAGDVNSDGFDDVLVGTSAAPRLYLGGPSGLGWCHEVVLQVTADRPAIRQDRVIGSAGDLDGDGYDEVFWTDRLAGAAPQGRVYLFDDLEDLVYEPCPPPPPLDPTGDTGLSDTASELDTDTDSGADGNGETDAHGDEARECGCTTGTLPSPFVAWLLAAAGVTHRRRDREHR